MAFESGKELRRLCLEEKGVNVLVALSPDGKQLISGHRRGSVRLWDLGSGNEIRCFIGHTDTVDCVAFHPDGRRALSGSMDRTVRVWDVKGGEELRCFAGHSNSVWELALSPDGRRLLSGGGGSEVRLWRLP
jgi:WD40 repeat protein